MKAIMVMYDSLCRNYLPNYGCPTQNMPNFERLNQHCVTFDNNYAGSLPCMPARRELHTGRYNFLHREWGPLEPFDDSMPELLKKSGIYTHLISDHCHYWEDGGATYHGRYNSWQNVRGQEGDHWIPRLGATDNNRYMAPAPKGTPPAKKRLQNSINVEYVKARGEFPQEETFRLGEEFIHANHDQDNWFLQIETFDPHEPFSIPDRLKEKYEKPGDQGFDWPPYGPAFEDAEIVDEIRRKYQALLEMCDECLGRVLDLMDQYDLWKDTMLIVNTDHGFLLGEREWWGKNIMPLYNELVRTPLFIWDPRCKKAGEHRKALVQTIDLAPTLLDYFGVSIPQDMQGKSLAAAIAEDASVRDYALYGNFGAHVNITDGQWYYMRAPQSESNEPLYCYTQMPVNLIGPMRIGNRNQVSLTDEFSFTKGTPVLRFPVMDYFNRVMPKYKLGNKLLKLDDQDHQVKVDDWSKPENRAKEVELLQAMCDLMKESQAPADQYLRLGLPQDGCITEQMLSDERADRRMYLQPEICPELQWTERACWEYAKLLRLLGEKADIRQIETILRGIAAESSLPAQVDQPEIARLLSALLPAEEFGAAYLNIIKDGKID